MGPNVTRVVRLAAWSLAAAIVVLSLVPPSLRPETGAPHDFEHFLIYYVTALAFSVGYEIRYSLLATVLVIFSGAVEVAQLFVPGRHARLRDFAVDALSMCAGVMTVWLIGGHRRGVDMSGSSR